ncbi:MAG: fasciclin domain-containing protein [Gloeobacterales cyanobacterium]
MLRKQVLGLGMALLLAVAAPAVQAADIVKTAEKAGSFKTLVTALKAADLVVVLEGKGPFTVFAPTDEAFAKLPKGTLEDLLKPENKAKLAKILKYHVVSGEVLAKNIKPGKVKTVEGADLTLKIEDKKVEVNDAYVTKADVVADNGVIHVIDKVLMPPTK